MKIVLCFLSAILISNADAAVYRWMFNGKWMLLTYNFDAGDYRYYKSKSKREQNMAMFAIENESHPYLAAFAEALRKKAHEHGWYGASERDMVIRFVQQAISYKKDPYNYGYDYPRYPIETLMEHGGDCEDKSCLLSALLKTLGYDCVLLEFKKHMAVGVVANDFKGSSFAYNEKNYLYVESTSVYPPGKNPGYKRAKVKLVRQTAFADKVTAEKNNK